MIVKICIGSSCHLKGSYDVVQGMREMLRKYDVEELVELQAGKFLFRTVCGRSGDEGGGVPGRLRGRVCPGSQ